MDGLLLPGFVAPSDGGATPSRKDADGDGSEAYSGLALLSSASTISSVHSDSLTNIVENLSPRRIKFISVPSRAPEYDCRQGPRSPAASAEKRRRQAFDCAEADPPAAPRAAAAPAEATNIDGVGDGSSSGLMDDFRPEIEIGQELSDDENAGDTAPTMEMMERIRLFWFGGSFQCVDVVED